MLDHFSSVPRPIGSSGRLQGRFSRDRPPVFSAGGPCEQIWHGQGCPLFDVVHPAFLSADHGWMDVVKEWTSLPLPELLTVAFRRKDWRRIECLGCSCSFCLVSSFMRLPLLLFRAPLLATETFLIFNLEKFIYYSPEGEEGNCAINRSKTNKQKQ